MQYNGISKEAKRVKTYVERGGGYLGFCAGSFFLLLFLLLFFVVGAYLAEDRKSPQCLGFDCFCSFSCVSQSFCAGYFLFLPQRFAKMEKLEI